MEIAEFLKNSILIFTLTMDSFMVSFAYGASKIKIPFLVIAGMNVVMSGMLGMAVWIGSGLNSFMTGKITDIFAAILLAAMGVYQIKQSLMARKKNTRKQIQGNLSFLRGLILAFALSMDSVVVGIGAGLLEGTQWAVLTGTFLMGVFMMEIGWKLGKYSAGRYKKDLSWIGGGCLLLLAFFALL